MRIYASFRAKFTHFPSEIPLSFSTMNLLLTTATLAKPTVVTLLTAPPPFCHITNTPQALCMQQNRPCRDLLPITACCQSPAEEPDTLRCVPQPGTLGLEGLCQLCIRNSELCDEDDECCSGLCDTLRGGAPGKKTSGVWLPSRPAQIERQGRGACKAMQGRRGERKKVSK